LCESNNCITFALNYVTITHIFIMIGTTEIIVIALVILLLFGGAKIPQLMKGLGKGIHEYKKGLSGEDIDDEKSSKNNDDK